MVNLEHRDENKNPPAPSGLPSDEQKSPVDSGRRRDEAQIETRGEGRRSQPIGQNNPDGSLPGTGIDNLASPSSGEKPQPHVPRARDRRKIGRDHK